VHLLHHWQCYCHTIRGNAAGNGLYESLRFSRLGVVLGHFPINGKIHDGVVWAQALNGHELIEYGPADGDPVDLATADAVLQRRIASRIPKWQRDCFLQFVLPFLVLTVLFSLSYALVLIGVLKGIGSPDGVEPAASSMHQSPGIPTITVVGNGGGGVEL
jgi:hypothetical protein